MHISFYPDATCSVPNSYRILVTNVTLGLEVLNMCADSSLLGPLPINVQLGFAAGTGGGTQYQEIRDLIVFSGVADLSITNTNARTAYTPGATTYTIVATNNGPAAADGVLLTDPAVSGLTVTGVTCSASTGGAVCPTTDLTVANLQGTGIVIPTFPVGSTLTFTVSATVAAGTTGNISNAATLSVPSSNTLFTNSGVSCASSGGVYDHGTDTCTATDTDAFSSLAAPACTVTSPATSPVAPTAAVTITCAGLPAGTVVTIPNATCSATPATGGTVTCTSNPNAAALGNNPPATVTDTATGASNTAPVPLQIAQNNATPLPPPVPVCTATPAAANPGAAVSILCTGGTQGNTLTIPNTTCTATAIPASGQVTCTGTAGIGAGQINSYPTVTVTDASTTPNQSSSGIVPFVVNGTMNTPVLPNCSATPNPAGTGTTVTVTCNGGTPGDTLTIPGTSCTNTAIPASGTLTCTGGGGEMGNNPELTVTDPTTGGSATGTLPLVVDTAPPTAPACTVTAPTTSPVAPSANVTITCQVDAGTTTVIPGATCSAPTGTPAQVTCTGTGSSLGDNPPATSTDAAGNESTAQVPLVIAQSGQTLPPSVPHCTPTPASPVASGAAVTLTCTGGPANGSIAIPGATCPALDANGNATCTGVMGTGAGQINENPSVTVTDPASGLSASGIVPIQIQGGANPPLPDCTATPNPAGTGTTVSVTCNGGTPGDTVTIPGTDCTNATIPASGTLTCTGGGGDMGNNPGVTVADPNTGDTTEGSLPLVVDTTPPTAPACTVTSPTTSPVSATANVTITCTVDADTTTTIPGATCSAPTGTPAQVTCTGTGSSLGNNPPATSVDAAGNESTAQVPLVIAQGKGQPLPPPVPNCTTTPASPVPSGATVSIACSGGPANGSIVIPGATCPALDANGSATCTGTVGTGAGQINENPSVTVTDPASGLSDSGTVPLQIQGSANPALPNCQSNPNPVSSSMAVTITCSGGTPGDTVTIPGSNCANAAIPAGGTLTCTGTGGDLGSNPSLTVTDPATGNSANGSVPLVLDDTPPASPVCTATPSPASPSDTVTIRCTVDADTTTTIPGAVCSAPTGTPAQVTCTGTGSSLGNNPPVTSTDPVGNVSVAPVPLQINGTPPIVPACQANPNPADPLTATQVTFTCTGGTPGNTIAIANTVCTPTTIPASGTAVCVGVPGIGATQVNENPTVTVTDPVSGLSNSGTAPFRLLGSGNPALPNCTASPNPALLNETVTIACTGGTAGDTITIPGASCAPATFAAAGQSTCTGTGGSLGSNPTLTVSDPAGNTSQGTLSLRVIGQTLPVPTLRDGLMALLGLMLAGAGLLGLRRRIRAGAQ